MVADRILRYVQGAQAVNALNAGLEVAESRGWLISGRASHYQLAAQAFGPTLDYASFLRLYKTMNSYWRIGRKGILAPPERVFEMLTKGCESAGRHTGCTLLSSDSKAVHTAVRAMTEVKIISEYPHMAAAKFLHFYNPALFPIYDGAMIWNRILYRAFRSEWEDVCDEYGIKFWEGSEAFLITYTSWAAEVMQAADPAIMVAFEQRFREMSGSMRAASENAAHYHAAAFEYLLMGAARLETTSS